MPRRRPYNRRKKTYRKYRKGNRNPRNRIVTSKLSGPAQQPDRLMVKLKYTQKIDFSGANTVAQIFRANGLFDPDLSGSGFQPNGFDQYAAFYTRYRVHAAKIEGWYITDAATAGGTAVVSIAPSSTPTTVGGAFEGIIGNPYVKWCTVGPSSGENNQKLTNYVSIQKFQGKPGVKYDDVNAALIGALPSRETYWICEASAVDGISNVDMTGIFCITYYCEFYDRRQLSRS